MSGTVDPLSAARMSAHRLFVGCLLTIDSAVDCVVNVMLDDQRAKDELECCAEWLAASAERLPPAMHTRQLVELLAASITLDGDAN